VDAASGHGYTFDTMIGSSDTPDAHAEGGPPPGAAKTDPLVVLLVSPDEALAQAWASATPPPAFRLERSNRVVDALARAVATLVLVDAATAAAATGPSADLLRAQVGRCVWTGPAEAVDALGPDRIRNAYDILLTPVTPAVLSRRLADWARNIERTAALDRLGRRAEELARNISALTVRLDESKQRIADLEEQRARLEQALRRIRDVATLSRRINTLNLDQIVDVAVRELPAALSAERASLYFYDAATDRLILQGRSQDNPVAERVELAANPNSPMAHVVRRGDILLIGEFAEFQRRMNLVIEHPYAGQYRTSSCIIVPLKGGGRVLGVLNLSDKQGGHRFSEELDLPVIEQVSELIGTSLYNVELFREMEHRAKSDPLTGLANRRALEETLLHETDRARRYHSPLAVLMIDVDGLKDVNDRFGHPAGDAVLQSLAAVLLETVRSVDLPGRWAGDEFLVILPDTRAAQAEQLAHRLHSRAHDQPVRVNGHVIRIGLSIGVAQHDDDETVNDLIRRVDAALYAAKKSGRDRIATAAEPAS